MGLFNKITEPIFLKDDSDAKLLIKELEALRKQASEDLIEEIDEKIRQVTTGIVGEDHVHFELANSHIPMFILHDIHLEHEGLTAQIDYIIITRNSIFVIECKNLYGNIEITSHGDFIRTVMMGKYTKKEGIYSPVTQNQRHLELIKQIGLSHRTNIITKRIYEKSFYDSFHSVVVLANPKTILHDRYAKKEVRSQVIKADQLVAYIKEVGKNSKNMSMNDKEMEETAVSYLNLHKKSNADYAKKYRDLIENANREKQLTSNLNSRKIDNDEKDNSSLSEQELKCPKCNAVMVRRKAGKGKNEGKEFYGCSNFPKCRCVINCK